jgi:flagellar biosynthesis component FlhA
MLLGTLALVLSVLAVVTGSPTVLALLVADTVALWALATIRHARAETTRWPLRGSTA